MAKPKRRKATLHSAGKVTEADILARAKALSEDPSPVMPECEDGCVLFSPVAAARRGIATAYAARGNEKKLDALSKRGNELARAYAATLLVGASDKIPYVADIKLPGLLAPYVIRGKAKPFYLAGVQNHHDRQLRLLMVTPWAKKRRLHFWSTVDGIVCTAKRPTPPRAFLDAEADELDLERRGDRLTCPHPDADRVVLAFEGTKATLERCAQCAGDAPLLAEAAHHVAAPKITSLFRARVDLAPFEGEPVDAPFQLPTAALDAYRQGKLDDARLIEAAHAARAAAVRALPRKVLVAGTRSFGADARALLAALGPTPAETRALEAALAAHEGPVVLERATAARALSELWPTHGLLMLEAAAGDPETAKRLHKPTAAPEEAVDLVRRADREGAHRAGLSGLPTYGPLPPAAALADAVARAYRTQGAEAASRLAAERSPTAKGVALALLEAMGQAKGQDWRFTPADRDVAAALGPLADALLKGDALRYHETLAELTKRAGETTTFAPRV